MKAYNKENIPLDKVLQKIRPLGNEKSGIIFCETIRCAFKGKKRLETYSLPQSASLTAPSSEGALDASASKE